MHRYFMYEEYPFAVEKLRVFLGAKEERRIIWREVEKSILNQQLKYGQPMELMDDYANIPLYENTDEEAYKWLSILLHNVALKEGEPLVKYEESNNTL